MRWQFCKLGTQVDWYYWGTFHNINDIQIPVLCNIHYMLSTYLYTFSIFSFTRSAHAVLVPLALKQTWLYQHSMIQVYYWKDLHVYIFFVCFVGFFFHIFLLKIKEEDFSKYEKKYM